MSLKVVASATSSRCRGSSARAAIVGGHLCRGALERLDAASDRAAERERRYQRRGRRRCRDRENRKVVPRLKHDEPGEHDRSERQEDSEQSERRELEPKRRQPMESGAGHDPAGQCGARDHQRERDHATSR